MRIEARTIEQGIRNNPKRGLPESFLCVNARITKAGPLPGEITLECIFFGSSKDDVVQQIVDWHEQPLPDFPPSNVLELRIEGGVEGAWDHFRPSLFRGRKIRDWIARIVSDGRVECAAYSRPELRVRAEGGDAGFNAALVQQHIPYAQARNEDLMRAQAQGMDRDPSKSEARFLAEGRWPPGRPVSVEDVRTLYCEARLDAWRKVVASRAWTQPNGDPIEASRETVFAGGALESKRAFVVWKYFAERASSMIQATEQFALKACLQGILEIAIAAEAGDSRAFAARIIHIRPP